MAVSERIERALKDARMDKQALAKVLDITPQRLSQKFKDDIWDSLRELVDIAEHTGYMFEWLAFGSGHEKKVDEPATLVKEASDEYMRGKVIRPIAVTVDRSGKELMTYVPVKAQAGYMRGYGDAKYLEKLPAFSLPNFNDNGTFRMFQVDGDSMMQLGGGGLKSGDVVIGSYVEDFFSMRDNMVYVIVSTEGVVIKRIINRLSTSDKMLVLKSDNKNGDYPNVVLHAHQIKEVWEYKAHISRQLNFATDLYELINEIQVQQAKLAERVDEIDSKTRLLKK